MGAPRGLGVEMGAGRVAEKAAAGSRDALLEGARGPEMQCVNNR